MSTVPMLNAIIAMAGVGIGAWYLGKRSGEEWENARWKEMCKNTAAFPEAHQVYLHQLAQYGYYTPNSKPYSA